MDFEKVILKRHSVRGYLDDNISDSTIEKLKLALAVAPSGNNRQPYKFIFVKDSDIRAKIAHDAFHQDFISQAPLLCIACCEKGYSFDTAIAIDHMVLQAVNLGLGTCWIGWFEKEVVRAFLGIPKDMEIPIMVTLGYYDKEPEPRAKKSVDEITSTNRY